MKAILVQIYSDPIKTCPSSEDLNHITFKVLESYFGNITTTKILCKLCTVIIMFHSYYVISYCSYFLSFFYLFIILSMLISDDDEEDDVGVYHSYYVISYYSYFLSFFIYLHYCLSDHHDDNKNHPSFVRWGRWW